MGYVVFKVCYTLNHLLGTVGLLEIFEEHLEFKHILAQMLMQ